MPDNQRIEDLRRRVQKDPASIAFAQLAEELRRAGELQESVDTCRAGLALHPSYLSARVTLGRALLELNELDAAAEELTTVLRNASENLAAMKGLGEIYRRRGQEVEALAQFRAALTIARNDPDLAETVADLASKIEPKKLAASSEGLSQSEFLQHLPAAPVVAVQTDPTGGSASALPPAAPVQPVRPQTGAGPVGSEPPDPERERALRTLAALEGLLSAVHVARADRRP